MSKEFPNPCCRCGFCCIAETCWCGRMFHSIKSTEPCPSLSFDRGVATCGLAEISVPIGDGCCISARVIHNGNVTSYADMPEHNKKEIVRLIKKPHTS